MTLTYSGNQVTFTGSIGTPIVGKNVTFSWGEESKKLEPKNIFINGRTVVVEWNDGTKTQSTASIHDTFDPEIGFSMCLTKKMFGKKVYGKKLYRRMLKRAKLQNLEEDAQVAMDAWLTNSSTAPYIRR